MASIRFLFEVFSIDSQGAEVKHTQCTGLFDMFLLFCRSKGTTYGEKFHSWVDNHLGKMTPIFTKQLPVVVPTMLY